MLLLFIEIYQRGFLRYMKYIIFHTRYPLMSTVKLSILLSDNPPPNQEGNPNTPHGNAMHSSVGTLNSIQY